MKVRILTDTSISFKMTLLRTVYSIHFFWEINLKDIPKRYLEKLKFPIICTKNVVFLITKFYHLFSKTKNKKISII